MILIIITYCRYHTVKLLPFGISSHPCLLQLEILQGSQSRERASSSRVSPVTTKAIYKILVRVSGDSTKWREQGNSSSYNGKVTKKVLMPDCATWGKKSTRSQDASREY